MCLRILGCVRSDIHAELMPCITRTNWEGFYWESLEGACLMNPVVLPLGVVLPVSLPSSSSLQVMMHQFSHSAPHVVDLNFKTSYPANPGLSCP